MARVRYEEKISSRLDGAAETSKKLAEWRSLRWKNLNILGLLRRKEWPQGHRESNCQVRQNQLCQKEKEQSRLSKAETEAWQATCSSFSRKSNSKFVYSLLRSVAGSSSSSSSSPNFPHCFSPRESAWVFVDYLRFYFSVSQPKTPRRRARGYLSELRRATYPEESHSFFCPPSSPLNFLRLPPTFFCPPPLVQTKLPYPMLK